MRDWQKILPKSKPALGDFFGDLETRHSATHYWFAHVERHRRAAVSRVDGCRVLINSGSSQDRQHPEGGALPGN